MSPRKSRGWKVWPEPSGRNFRVRWKGKYGTGQETFVRAHDRDESLVNKRVEFQRRDAGLPALPRGNADYQRFRERYLRWLDSRRSQRTRYLAERALKLHETAVGAHFPSRDEVADFGDWLLETFTEEREHSRGSPANTARIYLRHCKAAFRWAMKHNHIDYDPFLFYEFPAAVKVARLLTRAEIFAIFRELDRETLRQVFFLLVTGLRLSEIKALKWTGLEKAGRKVYMTVTKSKTRRSVGDETKKQLLHPIGVMILPRRRTGQAYVFEGSKFTLSENFREGVRRAKVGRVRLHDLRHTWATYLGQSSKDLKAVMQVGGWNTQSAAMIYQHETAERLEVTGKNLVPVPMGPLKALLQGRSGKAAKEVLRR